MRTCPTYNCKGNYWRIQESPFVIKHKQKKNQLPKVSKSPPSTSPSSFSANDIKKQIDSCAIQEIPMYCKRYKKNKHPLL